MVGVYEQLVTLEQLCRVPPRVDRALPIPARIRQQLPPIDSKRPQDQGSIRLFSEGAMLPLHNRFGTAGVDGCVPSMSAQRLSRNFECDPCLHTIWHGAIICGLPVSVVGEGVRDTGVRRLNHLLIDGVVESLRESRCSKSACHRYKVRCARQNVSLGYFSYRSGQSLVRLGRPRSRQLLVRDRLGGR